MNEKQVYRDRKGSRITITRFAVWENERPKKRIRLIVWIKGEIREVAETDDSPGGWTFIEELIKVAKDVARGKDRGLFPRLPPYWKEVSA